MEKDSETVSEWNSTKFGYIRNSRAEVAPENAKKASSTLKSANKIHIESAFQQNQQYLDKNSLHSLKGEKTSLATRPKSGSVRSDNMEDARR